MAALFDRESWELASFIVTTLGLPLAIFIFVHQQRKERNNEEAAVYQQLSDGYVDFLELVIRNPDLKLRSQTRTPNLTEEQHERMLLIFDILISLFERAYLLVYEEDMPSRAQRRWNSWEDYMREWCRREDFYQHLDNLLQGEDPEFAAYIKKIATEVRGG